MAPKDLDHQRPDTSDIDQTTVRIMDGLRRLVRVLSTSARGATSQVNLTGAQRFVLRQIAAAPGLSIGELADRTLSRQSTVSEVVSKLTRRGLIKRTVSSVDARQTSLTLTDLGLNITEQVEPTAQERLAHGLSTLPYDMRVALANGLESWLATADMAQVPVTMFFEDDSEIHKETSKTDSSHRSRKQD